MINFGRPGPSTNKRAIQGNVAMQEAPKITVGRIYKRHMDAKIGTEHNCHVLEGQKQVTPPKLISARKDKSQCPGPVDE